MSRALTINWNKVERRWERERLCVDGGWYGGCCEHDVCFYACESDRDCADDMSCEHGGTVCEYP